MKNAPHRLVIVLAALCLHAHAQTPQVLHISLCHDLPAQGESQYKRFLETKQIAPGSAQSIHVRNISNQVIGALGRYCQQEGKSESFNQYKWETTLLQDERPYVLAWPGGKIAISTGMAKFAANDDQLACLFGNAVGHVVNCDWPKRSDVGYVYRRDQEKEADRIALQLTCLAGYNPAEILQFWENVERKYSDSAVTCCGSVPSRERGNYLSALLPEIFDPAHPCHRDDTEPSIVEKGITDTVPGVDPLMPLPQMQAIPPTGTVILILVKVVRSSSFQLEQFAALRDLGTFFQEETMMDGLPFQRVFLGVFSTREEAGVVLAQVQKRGFKDAYIVVYQDGKRKKI